MMKNAPNFTWTEKYEEEMSDEHLLTKNEDFKKLEKLREKAIRITNFLPLNAAVEKRKYEMNIVRLQDFIMLPNILFVKDCLNENAPGSFNDKFYSSNFIPLNHTTRSSSTYKLKVIN